MDVRDLPVPARAAELAEESVATVERWRTAARQAKVPDAEARLATLLADPDGPEFAIGFIDGVLRPADPKVAAQNLDRLSRAVPESVRWHADIGTQLAGGFAPMLPAAIVPAVRDSFLKTIGGLFLRLGSRDPHRQLAELNAEGGIRPMLAPIGSTASGHREAHRQLVDARDLLARDQTSAISISLAQLVGTPRSLDLDGDVDYAVAQLEPLYELAAASRSRKFINLEIERLHELELTVRVFQQLSERHPQLQLGLTLPASLPDSLGVLERVTRWATARAASLAASGTPTQVPPTVIRIVRGDHTADEHAEAAARGWHSAAFADHIDIGAQVLRMLDAALTPERCAAVRIVVATHTLFDTAFAWRLARQRGVEGSVDHEFLLGIDSGIADAVKRDVGGIQRYVPTLLHQRLAPVVPYLLRRVEELTADGAGDADLFLQALSRAMDAPPATLRRQDPDHAEDTDLSIAANRDWAHAVLQRARTSAAGEELVVRARQHGARQLNAVRADGSGTERIVATALAAGIAWGERRGNTRAEVLDSVAETLIQWRGQLIEVAVSESQLTFDEADREVTIAVDSAKQAAVNARDLDQHGAVRYIPPKLIVVVGARTSPLANTVAELSSALAAGAAVILKAAPETERSSAVVIQALLAGGVPDQLVTLVCGEDALAQRVISHPSVDRVIVAGHRHTAKLFHSWGAEISLQATIGGRNSVIVTPSADLEAAVADIVAGALDHAGQASTATNLVILVGSVADSERFRGRLRDAVSSVVAGSPLSPSTQLSSLASPASGSGLSALQDLGEGETWLVRPQQVDSSARVWMPGLRDGVEPGSTFHTTQNRTPVLGLMTADTLTEAIELHNALGFGLAASIHSADVNELTEWLDTVRAGMLFINRATTQSARSLFPHGGWGRSHIGSGRMSGGRNELRALGAWEPVFTEPGNSVTLHGVSTPVRELVEAAQPSMSFLEFDQVRSAVLNDEAQWQREFGIAQQLQDSPALTTVVRYRPVPVTVRLAEGAPVSQLVRVLAAAARAHAPVAVSTATSLPDALIELFGSGVSPVAVSEVLIESAVRWHARVQSGAVQSGAVATERIRLIGGDATVLARVLHGRPGIAVEAGQVTADGRNELVGFLREQSISADLRRARAWNPLWGN